MRTSQIFKAEIAFQPEMPFRPELALWQEMPFLSDIYLARNSF
jgi:hypothetical protein